jgi:hypothetical protein
VNLEIASLIELAASSAGCSAVESSSFDAAALAFSTTSAAACLVVAVAAVVGAGGSLLAAAAGFAGGLTAGFAAAFVGAAGFARAATFGRSVCQESSDDSFLGILQPHMRMRAYYDMVALLQHINHMHNGSNTCGNLTLLLISCTLCSCIEPEVGLNCCV